jgi:RNA polymerase sigma factor (TIGR02999 family)
VDANPPASQQITAWLTNWRMGDMDAQEKLFATVYPELRQIAARFLRNERGHHTLEPAALVNELCIRLLGSEPVDYHDRAHFFAVASQAMRRILIDYARARTAVKRGGEQERLSLSAVEGWNPVGASDDLIALDQALSKLEKADPGQRESWSCAFSGASKKRKPPLF